MKPTKVNRQITKTLSLFILFTAILRPALARDLSEIVKKVQPCIVLVIAYDSEGKVTSQGCGFFISATGDVVMNLHVLEGTLSAKVKTEDGKFYLLKGILAIDEEEDLVRVAVEIPYKLIRFLSVSTCIPVEGERIALVGSTLGPRPTFSEGIVSSVGKFSQFGNDKNISVSIQNDTSGSVVVNNKGEVIGMSRYSLDVTKQGNLNFNVLSEKITNFKSNECQPLPDWTASRSKERQESGMRFLTMGLNHAVNFGYKGALPYFKEAARINPSDFEYLMLGDAYSNLGIYSKAVEAYKQSIRIAPDHPDSHLHLGIAYKNLDRNHEALDAIKQAVRIDPDNANAHFELGIIYFKLRGYAEAVEVYKQAIRIKPDYADAYCNMGVAYIQLTRYAEAMEAFKNAILIKSDFVEAHVGLGLSYLALGDKGSAFEQYKILKELDRDKANEFFNLIYK